MTKYHHISIVGAGNLGTHLALHLENTGHHVQEIFSRNAEKAQALLDKLYSATYQDHLDFTGSESDIFILAVADQALEEISSEIQLPPNSIILHTSGSMSMQSLSTGGEKGVLYPLQTFSLARKIDFKQVPILIEGSSVATTDTVRRLARSLSGLVSEVNSEQRFRIHLAAVFASNFTNHLLYVSENLLAREKLSFELLKPLITETINKALENGPATTQTGPAKRGDLEVLDQHMQFLKGDEAVAAIYKSISQHILDKYTTAEPD